jgi:hypothetical protein
VSEEQEQQETQQAYRDEEGWYVLADDGLPEYIEDDQVEFPGDPEQQELAEYGERTLTELEQHQAEQGAEEALVEDIDAALEIVERKEGRRLSDREIRDFVHAWQDGSDSVEIDDLSDPAQRREYLAERYQEQPEGDEPEWS